MPEPAGLDIRADHWEIVRAILRRRVPGHEVWAFGSRAKQTAKPHSDLDLAVALLIKSVARRGKLGR